MPDDYLLTVPQVADCAQLNAPAIYRWIREGRLAAVHVGRTIRVRASQVEKVLGVKPERPETRKAS
jgi:excisionase family DNA binding protein